MHTYTCIYIRICTRMSILPRRVESFQMCLGSKESNAYASGCGSAEKRKRIMRAGSFPVVFFDEKRNFSIALSLELFPPITTHRKPPMHTHVHADVEAYMSVRVYSARKLLLAHARLEHLYTYARVFTERELYRMHAHADTACKTWTRA